MEKGNVASFKPIKNGINISFWNEDDEVVEVDRQLQIINNLITNFDYLSNSQKFKLLLTIYSFIITYEDLIRLTNLKYDKHFDKIESLSTTIFDKFNDYGNIVKYGITLDCATTKDFIAEKRRYSYEEINNLISEGKIYPLFARAIYRNGRFCKEEMNTQKYYDAEQNEYLVNIILKNSPINIFVPNEIKLGRYSGCGEFYIYEKSIDENSADLFMKLFSQDLTKSNVFETAKGYILELKRKLENIYYNYYNTSAKNELVKIKTYYDTTFNK